MILITGCDKDKTPNPLKPHIPTKWELIPGNYKVYDTTGEFLYDMSISYSSGTNIYGNTIDTAHFENFDGEFDFSVIQAPISNFPNMISMGFHDSIRDGSGNRWRIFPYVPDYTYNNFLNDTILFYFQKHNTPYWLNDGTSYFYCDCKQIAVKQH